MPVASTDPYRLAVADTVVELVATKRMLHSAEDLGRILGLTQRDLIDAVDRFKVRRRTPGPGGPLLSRHLSAVASAGAQRPKPRPAPSPAPAGQKWCGWHQEFHPVEEFTTNRSSKDGLQYYCRAGNREASRASRAKRKATGRP